MVQIQLPRTLDLPCTDRRPSRRRQSGTLGFSGLIATALSLLCGHPATGAGFGHWESTLRQCSLETGPRTERPCGVLRLEQPMAGLLNVRFVRQTSRERSGSEEMVFAGDLSDRQRPLRCDAEGRCQPPQTPLRVRVRMVAWTDFDVRGLAQALPQSRLASGECLIERLTVRCDADLTSIRADGSPASAEPRWSAQALLPP